MTSTTRIGQRLVLLWCLLGAGLAMRPAAAQAQLSRFETEVAVYDAMRGRDGATAFRFAWLSGGHVAWRLAPMAGVMITTNGSRYGYGGLYVELELPANLYLVPSFAGGLYSAGGGLDLGHTIEFQSSATLGWRFPSGMRLGVAISHVSNGSLGRHNPGTETLGLSLMLPLRE